jgi:hypothetical protein
MEQTVEVIKVRIESLQHTRQLVTFLAGGLTGVYTVIGLFSANLETFYGSGQALWSWLSTGWSVLVLGLLLTLGATNICLILSVFLLTDSIHNYSKILEYRQSDLFADANDEAILAHHRALSADDLSYYYLRVGMFFLVFNLLLALLTVGSLPIPSLPLYVASIGILICALVAFFLVLGCYRVSHYKVPEYSLGKAILRFWNPRRWRKAVRKLHRE